MRHCAQSRSGISSYAPTQDETLIVFECRLPASPRSFVQTEIRPQVVLLAVLSFLTGGLAPAPTQASSFEGSTESCTKVQVKQIEQEATKGSATAQKHLGDLYAQGQCVSQDYVQAASWYRRSAEQENAEAQLELGMFLLEGKEVPQDAGEAAKWFRRAAEQNLHPAQYALGSLYSQ